MPATAPTWTNWVGNQSCTPARIERADDAAAIADAIHRARAEGLTLRTPGTGHSFSPVVTTDGVLLDTSALRGILGVDAGAKTVTVRAQTPIADLGPPLLKAGLALKNQGDIDTQTVAGAVATSTHGSGLALGSYSAELTACTLIDGQGQERRLSAAADPDIFGAAQCAVGMLGVMTEMTLQVTDAYTLEESILFLPVAELRERWDDLLAGYRHFSFFWMPTDRSAALYGFPDTPADHCMVKLYNVTDAPAGSGGQKVGSRIDHAYRIYPHVFEPNFHELEYFIPASNGIDAFEAHRDLMLKPCPTASIPWKSASWPPIRRG